MKTVFCSSAIILNSKKECLITSRNNKTSLKDYFEFPGGKLEKNEGFVLEYFELRCSKTLKVCSRKNIKNCCCRAFICVVVEDVRLIDNLVIINED